MKTMSAGEARRALAAMDRESKPRSGAGTWIKRSAVAAVILGLLTLSSGWAMGWFSTPPQVAEVRSAVALTPDQQTRLAAALANATGKQVNLKVVIDPTVMGGLVATVGDTVIDGSVRSRLEQLKSRL